MDGARSPYPAQRGQLALQSGLIRGGLLIGSMGRLGVADHLVLGD
jgi:hypothetical protein